MDRGVPSEKTGQGPCVRHRLAVWHLPKKAGATSAPSPLRVSSIRPVHLGGSPLVKRRRARHCQCREPESTTIRPL